MTKARTGRAATRSVTSFGQTRFGQTRFGPALATHLPPARLAWPGAPPIDLAAGDPVDANILDDDAFFATLRDAVHDEKPLGPRDEDDDVTGENRFFDQDAERGSFRDVFRRRR